MAKIKKVLKQIKPTTLQNIKSSFALEKDYYKKLKDLSTQINKSVLWWAMSRYNKTFDKNVAKQLSFEFNELLNEWDKKTEAIANFIARKMAKNTEKYVNLKFTAQNKDFNINARTKAIKNQLQAIYEKNYGLIKSIPSEIIERYRSAFLNNIGSFDREAIYKQAKTFQGISNRRAKTIARDQTQKAVSGYTQARAQQLGFEYYQWVTAGDERVSTGKGGHKVLNGRIYKYSEPGAIVDNYGNKGHPSTRVNCLAKGQGIDFTNMPLRIFRTRTLNKSSFVKISFLSSELIVTRDHKIFTSRGWVSADTLKKGDYILQEIGEARQINEIYFNNNSFIISDIFDFFSEFSKTSFSEALRFQRVGVAGNFDKDIRVNEYIDIIDIESFLCNGVKIIANECIKNLNFSNSNERISFERFISGFLSTDSRINFLSGTSFRASDSIVSFFSDLHSIFFSSICKSKDISLTTISNFITYFFKSINNNISTNSEFITHFKNAITCNIELFKFFYIYIYFITWNEFRFRFNSLFNIDVCNRITKPILIDSVELIKIDSHIYSLECSNGHYTAKGLINKNCRCTQVSVIPQPNQEFKLVKDSIAGDYYILVEKK